jgi:hypothetical protein
LVRFALPRLSVSYKKVHTNPHALAGTTKHETLAKLKEWS